MASVDALIVGGGVPDPSSAVGAVSGLLAPDGDDVDEHPRPKTLSSATVTEATVLVYSEYILIVSPRIPYAQPHDMLAGGVDRP